MKIAYVTNLNLEITSGGWSGINRNIFAEVSKYFDVSLYGPIDPPFVKREKYFAKALRIINQKSDFAFFSEKRLQEIRKEFEIFNDETQDSYFFFGNTPWIKIQPTKPYFVYLDADFITYLDVFSDSSKFSNASVKRISNQEKLWLENAKAIFFGSNWIMNETIKNLKISPNGSKYYVLNTGGHIPIPSSDNYHYTDNELNILFIALNFEKKGGYDALDIFRNLKKTFAGAKFNIIGEKPPIVVLRTEGVEYLGKLSKDNPNELKIMEEAFQRSAFLIHPTKMDTMGAIIPEANYFGTPVIASNKFGIPDLIKDSVTGILIKREDSLSTISEKIQDLFKNRVEYLEMRAQCRKFSVENFSWQAIGKKMSELIVEKSINDGE
jgi:glycosyltransferase involved in cell wall biosynthesis